MRLYTHAACLLHSAGPGHPESPLRLQTVLAALDEDRFAALDRVEAPRATREQLARVHDENLIDLLFDNVPQEGYVRVDADTTSAGWPSLNAANTRDPAHGRRRL